MAGAVEGKVVVVTGAGRGIGRDIALMMAKEGAKVVVNDLGVAVDGSGGDNSPAAEVVSEIKAGGGEAIASYDSVATWASAQRIIQCALDSFGRIDGVVNNAGILRDRIFFKMEPEEWQAVIDVHLNGTFYMSRAAAPRMRDQATGAFVHMTSTSALIGNFGQVNYMAAKLGVAALSKGIALDMARFGVRSNCISPFAWSRMVGSIPTDTPEQQARVAKAMQMETRKIAPMAIFLISDAGKDVSGQIFGVRCNEIFLFSQNRPVRSIHDGNGWTPQTIAEHAMPALKSSFTPLERSPEVFNWDPV